MKWFRDGVRFSFAVFCSLEWETWLYYSADIITDWIQILLLCLRIVLGFRVSADSLNNKELLCMFWFLSVNLSFQEFPDVPWWFSVCVYSSCRTLCLCALWGNHLFTGSASRSHGNGHDEELTTHTLTALSALPFLFFWVISCLRFSVFLIKKPPNWCFRRFSIDLKTFSTS